ncbi:MAG: hypothetical protein GTO18_10865 [Anaerolineales bacterium]|nr:hypothetical protein [Anaerolineales bacterium]
MKVKKVISDWRRIREGLIDTIEKFTEDELTYKPYDTCYSVGQTMLHIAHEEFGEIQYGLSKELHEFPPAYELDEYPTIGSIKDLLTDVHTQTEMYLNSLEDQDLEDEFEAQWGETRPLIDFIFHVMEHEIHHRGELSLIIGLLGREGLDA